VGSLEQTLARLARFLTDWGHPFAIVGGVAVIARAQARVTFDVDVAITVPRGREGELLAAAEEHGFSYDADETRHLIDGGLVRLAIPGGGPGADLMFVDGPFLEELVARATPVAFGALSLPVATTEDLLLMKLESHRPRDIDDAFALLLAGGPALDRDALARRAQALGIGERFANLLALEHDEG